MKKIVSILAVAALATSVFAADVAAKVKLNGSLFNMDADGNVAMFNIDTNHPEHWNPVMALSANGDVAGASVNFWVANMSDKVNGWNKGYEIATKGWAVWCKPLDFLKFTMGSVSTNLNQEMIDWSKTKSGVDGIGYAANMTFDAVSVDVIANAGDWATAYIAAPKGGKVSVGETYVKGQYGADWGTVNACIDFSIANGDVDNLWFGEGYKTTVAGVTMFENILVNMNKGKYNGTTIELFASGNVAGVNLATFLQPALAADNTFSMFATAKASYSIGAYTPYLYIACDNWADAGKTAVEVKPGVTTSVGTMAFEGAVDIKIANKVTVDVPVSFTVAF